MVCRCGGGRQGTWTGAGRLAAWCPDANACLPGACADKTPYHSVYEESSSAEYQHDCNRESYGVPIAIDNADHASSGVIKFEETVLCECHSGYGLEGTPDGNKSFTTMSGVAASGLMAWSPTLGSSASTTCHKVTCGIPLLASFGTASVGSEVFFHDVAKYSCELPWSVEAALLNGDARTVAVVKTAH